MALPGLLKQKRGGLFGSMPTVARGPYDTPGIGNGTAASPMAPAKPKFFGEGGVGRAIAGNIGDFLLQYSGMDPIYQPAMQQRQAMAYDQQQRDLQRRQGLEDWVAKQEWGRANPKPVNNDTVADYQFIVDKLGPDAGEEFLRNRANPPQYRQGPDGRFYRIDVAPNDGRPAIGSIVPDPRKQGGQSASPAGNFPR